MGGLAKKALGAGLQVGVKLLRDGDGIVTNSMPDPASLGLEAFEDLSKEGMKSVSLAVNSRNDTRDGDGAAGFNGEKKAIISGEWLLSKYTQLLSAHKAELLLNNELPADGTRMAERKERIAEASIEVVDKFADLFGLECASFSRSGGKDVLEDLVQHYVLKGRPLSAQVRELLVSVLSTSGENTANEEVKYGHIAAYDLESDNTGMITFYSIVPHKFDDNVFSLELRDVTFRPDLIFEYILANSDAQAETAGFMTAKKEDSGSLLLGIPTESGSPPEEGRGNDGTDTGGHSGNGESQHPQISIIAALVHPYPNEHQWVTIFNFSPDRLNLAGWKLHDQDNGVLTLNGGIEPGTAMTIRPRTYQEGSRIMLHNEGGTLQLKSKSGDLVDEATWQNAREGNTVSFVHHLDPPQRKYLV